MKLSHYKEIWCRGAKKKNCLVLDKVPYRYQQFISDIAGQDIQAHNRDAEEVVKTVRNWLRTASSIEQFLVEKSFDIRCKFVRNFKSLRHNGVCLLL